MYRVCYGFRLVKQDDNFLVDFDYFWSFTFRGNLGSSGNWLKPKTKQPLQILIKLSLSKYAIHTVFHSFNVVILNQKTINVKGPL